MALNEEDAYDLVLTDVPCSGTGTLGRNPEIRHRLRQEELVTQAERQRAILRAALRAVRPGGRVVYSTCSMEPEENEEVVAAVLAEVRNARVHSARDRIEGMLGEGVLTRAGAENLMGCVTPEGYLRLFPGVFGTDGFFVAVIEKTNG
jgi:16S rRNA (cytosine967-C5)-methyltransferase